MNAQTDHLSDINKKHRQKMLLLMKKTQVMYNRPSPLTSNPHKLSPPIPSTVPMNQRSSFDFLKQYESNKTSSQPQHDASSIDKADKSMDYNSTLFRYFKQQSNIAEKPSEFMNNGSSLSSQSGVTQNLQSNQLLKDNNLLSKIDQLLNARKKTGNKSAIKGVYQQYLEKKSMSNSSAFSNNNSNNLNQSHKIQQKVRPSLSLLNKLKTIEQQQKATLTIDRQQQDLKLKKAKTQKQQRSMKKPPLAPLQSNSAIERQKKKIQQTMQQIKREQSQFIEKDSLILQFSDNESQQSFLHEKKPQKEKEKQKEKKQDKEKKRALLMKQREELNKQLLQVQKELRQLQEEEEQQDEDLC